jgi:hypothetical protein
VRSEELLVHLNSAQEIMLSWPDSLPAKERAELLAPRSAIAVSQLSYIDGYWRIRRTTPMILKVIDRLNRIGQEKQARFWIEHLSDEAFHDRIMYEDLERLFEGSKALSIALDNNPISAPSVALLGYFEWQATHGNPHLLILLRLFLEWYFSNMDDKAAMQIHGVVAGGSRVLATHRELDRDHVQDCFKYVGENCNEQRTVLAWSLKFIAIQLRASQIWAATRVLGCDPSRIL